MRPVRATVRLGVLAAIAAVPACRAPRPCAVTPSATAQPAPRRDHCLAPPWVLDPAKPEAGVPGWSAAVCNDSRYGYRDAADRARRSAYFIHEGIREISGTEATAVLEAVRAAGSSSGLGGCCSPGVAREAHVICLQFWSNACYRPMSGVVQAVDEELRKRGLAEVRLGVDINITGVVGPRCEPADPRCGPISSRDWDRPDEPASKPAGCAAGRVRVAEPGAVTPGHACVHDGECMVAGCGSTCVRWDQYPHEMWCDDIGRLKEPPVTYCGCVAGRCDWFRVAQ